MKIITRLTDSQLDELFNKYSYDNIYLFEDGYQYWRIPELLSLGDYWYSDHNYCSTKLEGRVYVRSFASKHLREFTGLTIQEYFDLLVLHINDTEDRPKCSLCNAPLYFSGRVMAGYGSGGHYWNENVVHFCSRDHAAQFQYNNPQYYPITNEFRNSGGTFSKIINTDYQTWIEASIRSRRTAFILKGSPDDPCSMYITKVTSGYYKFGITYDLEYRSYLSGMVDKFIDPKIIYKSTRVRVANLEAYIKLYLNTNTEYLELTQLSEFYNVFDKLMNNLDLLDNFNSSTTISTLK